MSSTPRPRTASGVALVRASDLADEIVEVWR